MHAYFTSWGRRCRPACRSARFSENSAADKPVPGALDAAQFDSWFVS